MQLCFSFLPQNPWITAPATATAMATASLGPVIASWASWALTAVEVRTPLVGLQGPPCGPVGSSGPTSPSKRRNPGQLLPPVRRAPESQSSEALRGRSAGRALADPAVFSMGA